MKYKNYYKILELNSMTVTEEEIKNAYRRLAKQYHPDINQGDVMAAERFKSVSEAYHILGSEDSRKRYDRLHFAYKLKDKINFQSIKNSINVDDGINEFLGMFFGKSYKRVVKREESIPIKGENIETEVTISLEEAFWGADKKLVFRDQSGRLKTVIVNIPKGIKNNSKIRLQGQGKEGNNGGVRGDMLIKVNLIENSKFKLENENLVMDLLLTPWEAALGSMIEVQNIDSNVLITVPAGTESGEKLRVANNGYYNTQGGRGDLLLNVKIVIPKDLSGEERELYKRISEVSNFKPRQG